MTEREPDGDVFDTTIPSFCIRVLGRSGGTLDDVAQEITRLLEAIEEATGVINGLRDECAAAVRRAEVADASAAESARASMRAADLVDTAESERDLARERARELAEEVEKREAKLAELEEQVARLPALLTSIDETTRRHARVEKELATIRRAAAAASSILVEEPATKESAA